MEDHLGDMDFKVAGTKDGITALQMDIKIEGLSEEILKESLAQAKKGRLFILDHMLSTIPECRKEVSKYAPKVISFEINPDRIRDVIGSGGKVITEIINQCNNVKIDIEQDGKVFIMHNEYEYVLKAKEMVENLSREAVIGEIYTGKVIRIEKYGAFVELWPGTDGLVHISQIDKKRIDKVEDVLALNDEIVVKVIEIDDKGKIKLSRKDALKTNTKEDEKA